MKSPLVFLLLTASFATAKPSVLWYDQPAPDLPITSKADRNVPKIVEATPVDPAWENWSLPVGNGYLGASLFGRTGTERIQLTENSLATNSLWNGVGLTSFADVFLDFGHDNATEYRRELSLNNAVSTVTYRHGGATYRREYFASYPDKVLVVRLTADRPGSISFLARLEIPYLRPFGPESNNRGREGTVTAAGDLLTLGGRIECLDLLYEGQLKVLPTGGKLEVGAETGHITVTGADAVTLLVALGTNYQLEPRVFTEHNRPKKLAGYPHPHEKVSAVIAAAAAKSPDALRAAHEADYRRLFDRAEIDLGGKPATIPTDRLLAAYKAGQHDPYLEELYFNFGRYLLIASSRPGTLPPNLQGIWSQYEVTPWTGGYWHNINVQMNYWPVFNTNLAELFQPFVDYNAAYRPAAQGVATDYVKKHNPAALDPAGDNGWTIGTGASAYNISGPGGHSGPGTGALTTKMFWDYYEFTGDEKVLRDVVYPTLLGMARFLSKVVVEKDGLLLADPSYSPEQRSRETKLHYQTIGSAFDQQMIAENHADALKAAKILGDDDPLLGELSAQLPRLDPVQIGWSGQIKEYREEKRYGELVLDPKHRHTSQLLGLAPGTLINSTTPAWLDASRESLNRRGDKATGWGMALRLNCWARIKDGERAYKLYQTLLSTCTLDNLWDTHPPFQIDGNFGGTAGVAEMLLQSHEGFVDVLPALPAAWKDGSFRGLVARGNFEISARWTGGHADEIVVRANVGGPTRIHHPGIAKALVTDATGQRVTTDSTRPDFVEFTTTAGAEYRITGIPNVPPVAAPGGLTAAIQPGDKVALRWDRSPDAVAYNVYGHLDDEPNYRLVAANVKDPQFTVLAPGIARREHGLFRVTAVDATGRESPGVRVAVESP